MSGSISLINSAFKLCKVVHLDLPSNTNFIAAVISLDQSLIPQILISITCYKLPIGHLELF